MKVISLLLAGICIIVVSACNDNLLNTKSPTFLNNVIKLFGATNSQNSIQDSQEYKDEIYKLQQLTHLLVHKLYVPPYPSYKTFLHINKNLHDTIKPTCLYFKQLMQTAQDKTPYKKDMTHCRNSLTSMDTVLRNLQHNTHNHIADVRAQMSKINHQLINQLHNYKS